jgi:hypothetical protein
MNFTPMQIAGLVYRFANWAAARGYTEATLPRIRFDAKPEYLAVKAFIEAQGNVEYARREMEAERRGFASKPY